MFSSKIYTCILAVMLHLYTFSQQKQEIEDLIDKVENTVDDRKKIKLLDSLSSKIKAIRGRDYEFYKKNYPKYLTQYIKTAKGIDSFDLAIQKTLGLAHHYMLVTNQKDEALMVVDSAINDSNRLRKNASLGYLFSKRADINFYSADLEKALLDYHKAENILSKSKDSASYAQAIYFTGHTHQRLGNLTKAIVRYQEVNRLFTQLKDTVNIGFSKINISHIFSQLHLYDEAQKEREEAKTLLLQQKNKDYKALSRISVMNYRDFVKNKKINEGEPELLKALEYSKKVEYPYSKTYIRAFLAVFYSKHKKQPEIAQKYIDTIESNKGFQNLYDGKVLYWDVMSELKMAEGKYQEAILFLEKKLEAFIGMNDVQSQLDIQDCLYKANKEMNKPSKATLHLEKYTLLKDSLYNMNRSNSIIYYKTLYETEKRDSKIALQEANINTLEAKDKAKKNLLIFGGIGMSLLFLSIYLYRNRILMMRNKKLQQSFLQELLQTQERVRKRISKDLHDSVGQSLLLVKNKVLQNNDHKTGTIVDEVIDEVRGISRSLHPFKLEELGLTVTLQSSVEMIDENYDIFVSAEIDDIDKIFDSEKEINIYRLVQESFNNIIKHSNARSAEIIVHNKEKDVEIVIKDNGKGFDVSKEKTSASKIGLKTLVERSKFLKASFKILSEVNQGTTLIFNIPKYV